MSLMSDPLQAFICISQLGTVHQAAKALNITQTGVTQRIRSLEKKLGTTLFIRSRKGMLLTADGQELYRYCENVLRLETESLPLLKEGGQKPLHVRFVGPTSLMRSRLIPQITPLLKKHAKLTLHYDLDDFEDRVEKLKNGKADFALIRENLVPHALESKRLRADRFVLVAPLAWKKRSLIDIVKSERIIDFDPLDDMTQKYLKKFNLDKHTSPERHFVNNIESLVEMIENEHGYGVLEEAFLDLFLEKRKITILNQGIAFEHKMALCWMPRPVFSKIFEEIKKAIS